MDNFIFCAVRLLKFPLLKAGSRGAHETWFLNIFKSMFSLQLSIRLSLLWIISSFFSRLLFHRHMLPLQSCCSQQRKHLKSQIEAVKLRLQEDGNLVLLCLHSPIWSSGTHGNADVRSLVFQGNGKLALIKGDTNVAWSTNIYDSKGTYFVVQNDGNFALFNSNNLPLWASNTGEKCGAAGPEESTSRIFKSLILILTFYK